MLTIFTALCFLCGLTRAQSISFGCLSRPCYNKAICPPVNCSSGTVYDPCRCCQQCGLPNGSVCDKRDLPTDKGRYCAEGLVCEMGESDVEGICKGVVKQCQHGELWNVDDSTFCGCWGNQTVCQAAKRHRLSSVTPTPAIGVFGISVTPAMETYQSGSSANITCEYQGYPKPILVFTHNHKIIDKPYQTVTEEYGSVKVATLIIYELTVWDTGSYSCLVMNKAGMAETVTKHIQVLPAPIGSAGQAPVFIGLNHDQEKVERSKAVMECRAVGNPVPHVSITKSGQNISVSDRVKITHTVQALQGVHSLTLTFARVLMSDAGVYTCAATNDEGAVTSTSYLHVTRTPFLCTFETDNCGWSLIEDRSDIPWKRKKAKDVKGPSKDTTRGDSDGHFLYMHNSSNGGHFSIIEDNLPKNVCKMMIRHLVHGDNSTRLKIIVRNHGEKTVLAEYSGKASNEWLERTILEIDRASRLQIVGKLGRGHKHYIAVDDIRYVKCQTKRRRRYLFT